ncbi:MAG: hypothetical protein E6Q97_33650 [Desulfurellales bacterium]|nr:MAG: hypothetical protein E6Q97_33650 [Desulfurellales bacterium]
MSARQLIDVIGGVSVVSQVLGIKKPSVSEWIARNTIPDDKLIRLAVTIEDVTDGKISRIHLFPDDALKIWPELQHQQCACAHEAVPGK